MIRIERHALGPRCFLLGRRIHEWHVGLGMLGASAILALAGAGHLAVALLLAGSWLTIKDGNDLIPSRRNSTAWSPGLHRRPLALRERPRCDWLPMLAAWLTGAVGAVNVLSALTPELHGRVALLAHLAPAGLVLAAHAAVLPAGLALLLLSAYLARRRRRALWLAVGLLTAVGGLEVLKGLDIEEALVSWALAGLLVWGRAAFTVRHELAPLPVALRRAALILGSAATTAALAVIAATHWTAPGATLPLALRETAALLTLAPGPLHLGAAFAWLPLGIGLLAAGAVLATAWPLLAPLRSAERSARDRVVVATLVRRHGRDTLSAFKLRSDVRTLLAPDRSAFLAYRVQSGVLLVSGDPVGPPEAMTGLLRHLTSFAAERGLRIGAVGASAEFAALAREAGLSALYLGDEAIVKTAGFSLDGHRIKKVRQACKRLARAGYTAEARVMETLTPGELAELEALSARWRAGAAERGFSMAMDALAGGHLGDSVAVIARDASGHARGFLHFVPAYGRRAMSLSAMRRDRDTPNGLTDFLVVEAIERLREQGIAELSLNFAAFARWLHSPAGHLERVLARLLRRADRYFQIESLYRFNAKFAPGWQSRFLLYEGAAALPRTALAALWVEGHLPKPALPRPSTRRAHVLLSPAS